MTTRGGLLLSTLALTAVCTVETLAGPLALGGAMSPGFVAVVLLVGVVPRWIRPGRSWIAQRLAPTLAAVIWAGGCVVALAGLTWASAIDQSWPVTTAGVLVLAGTVVAALAPPESRRPDV